LHLMLFYLEMYERNKMMKWWQTDKHTQTDWTEFITGRICACNKYNCFSGNNLSWFSDGAASMSGCTVLWV